MPSPRQELVRHVGMVDSRFSGYSQQDPHDFLVTLLDELDEALQARLIAYLKFRGRLGNSRPQSPIQSLFRGEILQEVQCSRCKHVSRLREPFITLELAIPPQPPGPGGWITDEILSVLSSILGVFMMFWQLIRSLMRRMKRPKKKIRLEKGHCGLKESEASLSLEKCLRYHCQEEALIDNNLYDCERCSDKVPAKREVGLQSLPEILLIEIKR